jgi:hypothetical protein
MIAIIIINDFFHCKALEKIFTFVSVGVRGNPDTGEIKVENIVRKKTLKLLYRGTGNRQFLFIGTNCLSAKSTLAL